MRRTLSAGVLSLFCMAAAAGCAGQSSGAAEDHCPESCARARKCPGYPAASQSCDDECLGQDALAVQSGCHEEYLKSVECLVELENICSGLTDCKAEILTAQQCEQAYCKGHQKEDVCVYVPAG